MMDTDNVYMIVIGLVAAMLLVAFGFLIHTEQTNAQQLAEQCVTAGQQWVRGDCVK